MQLNQFSEASTGGVLLKKVFLEISQNSQENNCARLSFLIELQAWDCKETLAEMFSSEMCKISKNIFFTEHLRTTASEFLINLKSHFHKQQLSNECRIRRSICQQKWSEARIWTATSSKMEHFVIIVNGWKLGCCSSPRSASDYFS